ncbi:MAG: alpha/beta fold hydrolase, partial [Patescibacteria group bacterium]
MIFAKEKHPVKEKARPFTHRHANSNSIAILIHGFTGSPYDMRELADFLHNQGIDVMAVRLAGHGTNIEDLMAMNYEDWVLSVDATVREAEKEDKRIFLIGYSFGANLALELASRNPKRYDGIVCLGTSIYWQQRWYYFVLYHLFKLFGID